MTHFSLPSRHSSHVESTHTWNRDESDAIRRERCSLFPRKSHPSAKEDRVVTNDPHFSEAKDLRATWIRERAIRIRGTLIGADGGSVTESPTPSAEFAPGARSGWTSGDARRSCRRRSGPRGPPSA